MNVPNFAFLQDEDYEHLRPYYDQAIQKGIITSAGSLLLQNGQLSCFDADGHPQKSLALQYVAASGRNRQIDFQQPLVAFGVPKNLILDGNLFAIPGFNLQRFLQDGIICGELAYGNQIFFRRVSNFVQPQHWTGIVFTLDIGTLSYIESCKLEGRGVISVGNFSCISWDQTFEVGLNNNHHIERAFVYDFNFCPGWPEFYGKPFDKGRITIGSDVWMGRGCHLKASGRTLTIGDGAVISSNSNVVKDVPPYAIVGGNPAKFIRWRFPEHIREGLQKIRWWDWPLKKIHAARLEMKDPAAFVERYLPEAE